MATTMATHHLSSSFHAIHHHLPPHKPISLPNHVLSRRCCYRGGGRGIALKTWAMGSEDLLGDFGARDPFPAEIESGFAEKVLGNTNTEHKILIPNVSAFSLAQQDCNPAVSPFQQPMSEQDAQKLLRKIIGWRLLDEGGGQRLQCMWKLKDFKSGVELINRIYKVVEAAGHFPNLHLEQPNQVRAELWTASIGGLSMNDFIVAAKIDEIKMSDLVPRKRIWA